MRVAVIVVTMLVATTPTVASESCMSKAEARQHFPTLHIYWHGRDHCWDAMAAHRETPHMAAFGGKIGGMLAGRPEITRLDHVASLD